MAEIKYLDLDGLEKVAQIINTTKANLESPEFTGTPTAPTPEVGDGSTRIATTEFVANSINKDIASV